MTQTQNTPCFHFGMHKYRPLTEVPSSYIVWALTTDKVKLSSSTRKAAEEELARRGVGAPEPPAKPEPNVCPRCPRQGGPSYSWYEDRSGGKRIKRTCPACGAGLAFAPHTKENIAKANAMKSVTPIKEALDACARLGLEIESTGETCWIVDGWRRAPVWLRQRVEQVRSKLAKWLGKRRWRGDAQATPSPTLRRDDS
jgi:ribosomal protein S27AE